MRGMCRAGRATASCCACCPRSAHCPRHTSVSCLQRPASAMCAAAPPLCSPSPAACPAHRRRAGSHGLDESDQPISFNDQLYIYGGTSAQEDLEALSNESAR